MDEWLNIVMRQLILYSLPLLISLTLVAAVEVRVSGNRVPHPFYAISWRGCWIPFFAALFMHRGVIIALPNPLAPGIKPAAIRLLAHVALCITGLFLYSWSLAHQPPAGLPPLHHWWAKVLMFFNLCMATLHLLPIPLLLVGEFIPKNSFLGSLPAGRSMPWIVLALLAATPLLDLSLGVLIIYPVYEGLSSLAIALAS